MALCLLVFCLKPGVFVKQVKSFVTHGKLSKAYAALISKDDIADIDSDPILFNKAKTMYPEATRTTSNVQFPLPQDMDKRLTPENVKQALAKNKATGTGCSGMQFDVLVCASESPAGLATLTRALNTVLLGKAPPAVETHLRTGLITPIKKPNGDLRLIAVREVFLRLLAKSVVAREQFHLSSKLAPYQVGAGLSGGNEFMVHFVNQLREQHKSWVVVSTDVSNAYGNISRDQIHAQLSQFKDDESDQRASLFKQYYSRFMAPTLQMYTRGKKELRITEGLPQGDPTSPILFSLGLQPALLEAQHAMWLNQQQDINNGIVIAYLDDVLFVGPAQNVSRSLSAFKQAAANIKLTVNEAKCKTVLPVSLVEHTLTADRPQTIRDVDALTTAHRLPTPVQSLKLLGTAIGYAPEVSDLLYNEIDESVFDDLKDFASVSKQIALLLTRVCVSTTNAHVARLTRPDLAYKALKKHDDLVEGTVSAILEEPHLSDRAKQQIRLPLAKGGLGLPSLVQVSNLAYLASSMNFIQTLRSHVSDGHSFFKHMLPPDPPNPPGGPPASPLAAPLAVAHAVVKATRTDGIEHRNFAAALPTKCSELLKFTQVRRIQHTFTTYLHDANVNQFRQALHTTELKAWYNAYSAPHASAYLMTIPSERALVLSNRDMLIALRSRHNLPVSTHLGFDDTLFCFCGKNHAMCNDDHLLNCNGAKQMERRHHGLIGIADSAFQAVSLKPVRERKLDNYNNSKPKRFDLSQENPIPGVFFANFDLTCVNALCKTYIAQTAKEPLGAAKIAAKHKYDAYAPLVNPGEFFTPLPVEAQGGIGDEIVGVLKALSYKVNHAPPPNATWASPSFVSYWIQVLSCHIMRANAHNIELTLSLTKQMHRTASYTGPRLDLAQPNQYEDIVLDDGRTLDDDLIVEPDAVAYNV